MMRVNLVQAQSRFSGTLVLRENKRAKPNMYDKLLQKHDPQTLGKKEDLFEETFQQLRKISDYVMRLTVNGQRMLIAAKAPQDMLEDTLLVDTIPLSGTMEHYYDDLLYIEKSPSSEPQQQALPNEAALKQMVALMVQSNMQSKRFMARYTQMDDHLKKIFEGALQKYRDAYNTKDTTLQYFSADDVDTLFFDMMKGLQVFLNPSSEATPSKVSTGVKQRKVQQRTDLQIATLKGLYSLEPEEFQEPDADEGLGDAIEADFQALFRQENQPPRADQPGAPEELEPEIKEALLRYRSA